MVEERGCAVTLYRAPSLQLGKDLRKLGIVDRAKAGDGVPAGGGLKAVLEHFKQDRIDIGRIIELARTMLAQRQPDHPDRFGVGYALANRGFQCRVQRAVGKGREFAHDLLEIECTGKVSDCEHQREPQPFAPQCGGDIGIARLLGEQQCRLALPICQQFGEVGAGDVSAYFFAGQLGFKPKDVMWSPRFFIGFDYASGDESAGGDVETFNQLFPLGHAYLGFIDIIGRQNVVDASLGVRFKPHEKVTLGIDGHFLYRAEDSDALYNAGGGVVRGAGGSTSNEIGAELDLTASWVINRHVTFSAGYSMFFAGDFIEDTGASEDISFFYTQLQVTF